VPTDQIGAAHVILDPARHRAVHRVRLDPTRLEGEQIVAAVRTAY
jgi:hypothetical protein